MQGSTVERMTRQRQEVYKINSKSDKKTRRNRLLHRAIKEGDYKEYNTLNKGNNEETVYYY